MHPPKRAGNNNQYILIIEDNLDDSLLFSQIIERIMKLGCILVHDGLDAVRAATQFSFDLILLDLQLPGLKGWRIAEVLRQMQAYRDVPLIVITAYDHAEARSRARMVNCDKYLTKPVEVDTLIRVIGSFLPPS